MSINHTHTNHISEVTEIPIDALSMLEYFIGKNFVKITAKMLLEFPFDKNRLSHFNQIKEGAWNVWKYAKWTANEEWMRKLSHVSRSSVKGNYSFWTLSRERLMMCENGLAWHIRMGKISILIQKFRSILIKKCEFSSFVSFLIKNCSHENFPIENRKLRH